MTENIRRCQTGGVTVDFDGADHGGAPLDERWSWGPS